MKKPKIGIPLDYITPERNNSFSKAPWYALTSHNSRTIAAKGGIPVPLCYDNPEDCCDMIDGLLLTGSKQDLDPKLYGETKYHSELSYINAERTEFEMIMLDLCYKAQKPILGICNGMQTLNVYKGGSLYQHIPDQYPSEINHKQITTPLQTEHTIVLTDDALWSELAERTYAVNSVHHQGVKTYDPKVRPLAHAPDGLVEAFSVDDHPFCLGIQWHPEYLLTELDHYVFTKFIAAASR